MATSLNGDKRGHVCPPSSATHPSDRWESLFVYSFICKFTSLRGKAEGLESPMDLENALLEREPHPILTKVLTQFILNLKPQTRNLSPDQISSTVAVVLSEYFKSSERTVFWSDDLCRNVDPFEGQDGGFFAADWDFKLKILRQLVELQLTHAPDIKAKIDRAWGVVHNKHKKPNGAVKVPNGHLLNQEELQLVPIGQDSQRRRYWIADDSPRVYVSTNPWKITATFQSIASTKEEYLATIEQLKHSAPAETKRGQKRTKLEQAHLGLVEVLQSRVEEIDAELTRVLRVRKKIEQRQLLLAQAELRETRTRKRTQRPDYMEYNDDEGDDDDDYQEVEEELGQTSGQSRRGTALQHTRRSTRTTVMNKRESSAESSSQWRGERRSTRLGAPSDMQLDEPPSKRVKTSDKLPPTQPDVFMPLNGNHTTLAGKTNPGAATLKATEYAVDQLPGKRSSKYWIYAVEPVIGTEQVQGNREVSMYGSTSSILNGNGTDSGRHTPLYDRPEDKHIDSDRNSKASLSSLDSA